MCGIAGLLDPTASAEELGRRARVMAGAVAHRGPDDEGVWVDANAGIGFGHQRLSVVDLSPAGHQPMVSADGRWVITYNGECYNAPELRKELRADLRGHCDTEVVLEAVAAWGMVGALDRIDGMFALALWDCRERELHLVRDRLGEKPLYYALAGGGVLFGSELRALAADPRLYREIDRTALALLLQLNYIPAPRTIYAGARKLAAGTMVTFRTGWTGWPEPVTWWDFRSEAQAAMGRRPAGRVDEQATIDRLESVLRESVQRRLVADVPVGCFLSGGIDSSLVAALAGAGLRTFSVGFGGAEGDEAAHAAAVARHLGTDHTQIDLSAGDALAAVPSLPSVWDEPFADPSQLPTLLLCREARRQVTVALSGDGGDEMFGGYRRYTAGALLGRGVVAAPRPVRSAAARVLGAVPSPAWRGMGGRVAKLRSFVTASSGEEVYTKLVSAWPDPSEVAGSPSGWAPPALGWSNGLADQMMAWDTLSTLPDEMLVKVDRASMSVGLEVRVPLLAPAVMASAWELPPAWRVRGWQGKRALREVLYRHVPKALVDRPKAGFDPPLATWLRGPLREWASDLLSPSHLSVDGLLAPEAVQQRWEAFLAGQPGHEYAVWAVLSFASWVGSSPSPSST